FARTAALLAGILSIYVLGIPQCFGQANHFHFVVWFAVLLALSRCADAWSLDSLIQRRRHGRDSPADSIVYARPIRWVWLLMGAMYLVPGLWKIGRTGNLWFFGGSLISYAEAKWLGARLIPSFRIDPPPALAGAMGIGAIGFELPFLPLVLFRQTRLIVAAA